MGPNTGLEASTTTAFCTVDRVTSSPFTSKSAELICRLHLRRNQHVKPMYGVSLERPTICRILWWGWEKMAPNESTNNPPWSKRGHGWFLLTLTDDLRGERRREAQGTGVSWLSPRHQRSLLERNQSWAQPMPPESSSNTSITEQ